jgi:HK97 family phage major capsid protein
MAEFVRAQIFGTTFEITSRYSDPQPVGMGAFGLVCSARDQLTNQNVAVKKIMKPFSTPVLANDAGPAIGDAMGRHFLTGSGTNQPRGILTDASDAVATFAPGDADSKVSDALIDLFYELSSPYRTNASFVVNDKVAAQMRKLKDANGQYLWQSALTAGAPDLFNGKSVQTDTAVPVDKVMFGDLSKYRVRFAGPLRVDRSTDIKFMNDQVVYRFLQRADGLLVDQNAAKVLTIAEAGGGA